MWTSFFDMHSGGGQKTDWEIIYIEAPMDRAVKYFEHRFERNPDNVTCYCCGSDFSIDEYKTFEEATQYHKDKKSLVIAASEQKLLTKD